MDNWTDRSIFRSLISISIVLIQYTPPNHSDKSAAKRYNTIEPPLLDVKKETTNLYNGAQEETMPWIDAVQCHQTIGDGERSH